LTLSKVGQDEPRSGQVQVIQS